MRSFEMKSLLFPAVMLSVLLPGVLLGVVQAGEAQAPKDDTDQLIEKLRAEDFGERERAVQALIERGESVRASVEAALKKSANDPDYAMQLKSVLEGLSEDKILNRFDSPKRIDLALKDVPAGDVLKKLKQHFGWSIASLDDAEKKVSVSCKQATFFEALEALRKAADLTYQVDKQNRRGFLGLGKPSVDETAIPIALRKREGQGTCVAAAGGPFLVFLEQVDMNIGLRLRANTGTTNKNAQLNISGYVVGEPQLPHGRVSMGKGVLTDAKGRKLKTRDVSLDSFPRMHSANESRRECFRFYVSNVKDITPPLTWASEVKIKLPLELKKVVIKDLMGFEGKSIETPYGTLTIKEVKEKEKQLVYVTSDKLDNWLDMQQMHEHFSPFDKKEKVPEKPGVYFLDENGKPVSSHGYSGSGDGTIMTVTRDFERLPRQMVFIYAPKETERTYTFGLTGIPLPSMPK